MNEMSVIKRGYAKNMDEWWFLVRHHWSNLSSLIEQYLGQGNVVVAKDARDTGKAVELYMIFQRAWDAMPDSPHIHFHAGFDELCDLCSDFPYEPGAQV